MPRVRPSKDERVRVISTARHIPRQVGKHLADLAEQVITVSADELVEQFESMGYAFDPAWIPTNSITMFGEPHTAHR